MLDIIVASCGLLLMLPLLVLIVAAIFLVDRGPILFAQKRIGYGGKSFACFKFRTMVTDAEARLNHLLATDPDARCEWARDQKLRNDPRITRIGSLLRKSSLDEIPQLLNVLRGNMSIVGPRPIVATEIERYGAYFPYYCTVQPGITGYWQTSGRNNVSYRRRVAMDTIYARKKTLRWDVAIMLKTVPAVLMARGSY